MKKSTRIWAGFIAGIALIIVILVLIAVYPCPTPSQYTIFRIIISISAGAFASIIPGFFEFNYNGLITATAGLGVFALVYIFNPAPLVAGNECEEDFVMSGIVFINGNEVGDVDVRVTQLQTSRTTSNYGVFEFRFPPKEARDAFNFRVIYGTVLDTSFEISAPNWKDLKFYFRTAADALAFNPKSVDTSIVDQTVVASIPKKEIKNYFENTSRGKMTMSYGGDPYCNFLMEYTDILMQIKLSPDRTNVESAKVTLRATEKLTSTCPYEPAPSNVHIYDLGTYLISDGNIFISFVPDNSNNPQCALTFSGKIIGNNISGKLNTERIYMPDPILIFKNQISVDLLMLN